MKHSSGPRKIASQLSESLHKQLNMYAVAASAAGVGMLALAHPAEAKIIYTRANVNLRGFFPLDLNHDGKIDFYLAKAGYSRTGVQVSYLKACHSQLCNSSSLGSNAQNQVRAISSGTQHPFALALRPGAPIKKGERFLGKDIFVWLAGRVYRSIPMTQSWFGPWANGGLGVKNRYLGFKFKIKGMFHFGWARITVTTTTNSFTATLTGYAYENIPGKAIIAGQTKGGADEGKEENFAPGASLTSPIPDTPQPQSLGTLALGNQGVPLWRRKESMLHGEPL